MPSVCPLAGLLEAKKDYEAAIAEYDALLKDQPGSLIVANNLASLLADYRTDKASLERANSLAVILKKSEIPQFKDTLGWVSYQRQDYRAALPLLEDAAEGTAQYGDGALSPRDDLSRNRSGRKGVGAVQQCAQACAQ